MAMTKRASARKEGFRLVKIDNLFLHLLALEASSSLYVNDFSWSLFEASFYLRYPLVIIGNSFS